MEVSTRLAGEVFWARETSLSTSFPCTTTDQRLLTTISALHPLAQAGIEYEKLTDPSPHSTSRAPATINSAHPPLTQPTYYDYYYSPRWHRHHNYDHKNSSMSSCSSLATHPWGRVVYCYVSPISSGCPRMRRALQSVLTFGCARNLPSSSVSLNVSMGVRCGCVVCCGNTISGTQAGRSGTESQDEYMGASLCFLPLVRKG